MKNDEGVNVDTGSNCCINCMLVSLATGNTWTGQTFTTHTTLKTQQNQLAIKVSAEN